AGSPSLVRRIARVLLVRQRRRARRPRHETQPRRYSQLMASKRRFEFVEGGSSKFWEVEVEGPRMTVCFGRVGTAGSPKDKTFASAAESEREAAKLIAEKTKKGYVEVGATTPSAAAGATA